MLVVVGDENEDVFEVEDEVLLLELFPPKNPLFLSAPDVPAVAGDFVNEL